MKFFLLKKKKKKAVFVAEVTESYDTKRSQLSVWLQDFLLLIFIYLSEAS